MKHVSDLIPAYVDGRLDDAEREAVRAHCERCPACARALAESEAVWDMLDSVRAPAPSRSVWAGVAAATAERRVPAWQRLAYGTLSAAALAAGVLLGAQQYDPDLVASATLTDDIITGSLLSGETVWTLDSALDSILALDEESEEG